MGKSPRITNNKTTCPNCGNDMGNGYSYTGGTATKMNVSEVSTTGSMVEVLYMSQIMYTCKHCGATLLKPSN